MRLAGVGRMCLCLSVVFRGNRLSGQDLQLMGLRRRHKLLGPVQCRLWEEAVVSHTCEYQRDHDRGDATRDGSSQHIHLNFPLFETQRLLSRPLFFLPSSVLFNSGLEPILHRVLGSLPLQRRWRW